MLNGENLNSIEAIAATIAHEVKNPLSLVEANIDLLESADVEKLYSKNYYVIRKELNKINDMMLDFLELTKNSPDSEDIVYIYDVVSSVLESYAITLRETILFYFNCEDKDVAVLGNEKALHRVFLNVMKNSIEAIGPNRGRINIKIYTENELIHIVFEDNGCGLPKEEPHRAGELFFTTKAGGNGLGVPICKKIIAEHHGTFEIHNNNMNGCSVHVILPELVS